MLDARHLTPRNAGRIAFGLALLIAILVPLLLPPDALADDPDQQLPRYEASVRGVRPNVVRWRSLLEHFGDWDVDQGLRVIDCESDGLPFVTNREGSGATGLFQTMPSWQRLARELTGSADLTNPWVNVTVAHALWLDSGGYFGWYSPVTGKPRGHWAASIACWWQP